MSYLFGTGYWTTWYLLLWMGLLPFLWLAVPLARTAVAGHSPGLDLAFALCNLGLVLLLVTTFVSSLLWAAASPAQGIGRFLWPLVIYVLGGTFGAAGLYAVLYYVTAYAATAGARWGGYLGLLAGILAAHLFSLHAAWRFRLA